MADFNNGGFNISEENFINGNYQDIQNSQFDISNNVIQTEDYTQYYIQKNVSNFQNGQISNNILPNLYSVNNESFNGSIEPYVESSSIDSNYSLKQTTTANIINTSTYPYINQSPQIFTQNDQNWILDSFPKEVVYRNNKGQTNHMNQVNNVNNGPIYQQPSFPTKPKINTSQVKLEKRHVPNINKLSSINSAKRNSIQQKGKKIASNNIKNSNKKQDFNSKSMIVETKSTHIPDLEVNVPFPPGEHRYELIKDYNKSKIIGKNDNLSERVELFFSLINVENPHKEHSFEISIINSKKTGISTFLGCLKGGKGKKIEFGDSFEVDYFFEREQTISIEPQIEEIKGKNTGEEKFILSNLMTSDENKISIDFEGIGTMEIIYKKKNQNESSNLNKISNFQFIITLNNDIFKKPNGLNDIFYVIRNIKDGKKRRPVYKSHEYNFELNKEEYTSHISIESDILCNNDNMDIFFELYSLSINPKKFIGFCKFTLNQLKSNLEKDELEIIEIESKEYGKLGVLKISYYPKEKITLEKFIKKGEINLEIAIDYTKSNESNNIPSLHYKNGEKPNDYEKAIKSCGEIIAYYDSDQLFPVYGFGGIPEGESKVNHCFNINFNKNDPNIKNVDNIIKFYKDSLDKVCLSGPSFFSPVINKVISKINYDLKTRTEKNNYYILMILTDGGITDMKEKKDCIVEGSKLPLSIVIIGIGRGPFDNMDTLDGDKTPLKNSRGKLRERDIVQFVQFNKFKDENGINSGEELAEEVLKEIPRQIEEYYNLWGNFYE